MQLNEFWKVYQRENSLEPTTVATYNAAIAVFNRWFRIEFGKTPELHNIGSDEINDFLIAIDDGRSSYSVKSAKSQLMALLNAARRQGRCSFDPERIRKIKTNGTPKDFWRIEEVNQLLKACDELRGRFRQTQILKTRYAKAYIAVVWDTALRRGDMAKLRTGSIVDLEFSHPRSKTGVTDVCRVSMETWRLIQITYDENCSDRRLIFPAWRNGLDPLRAVSDLFNDVLKRSSLRASDSCLKKLVRSSMMEADFRAPGTAWLQGHHSSPNTTMQHYANRQQANLNRPKNRPLTCE